MEVVHNVEVEVKVSKSIGLESDVLGVLGWGKLGSLDSLSSRVGSSVDEVVAWGGADNKIGILNSVDRSTVARPCWKLS